MMRRIGCILILAVGQAIVKNQIYHMPNSKHHDRVDEALRAVDRSLFLPAEVRADANLDIPLPIGVGQTNSQPTTVRRMLRWLDPQPGDKVLDVGSGSGWTTALLAYLVGPKGSVYAVELVPELVRFGAHNAKRAGVKNARFFEAGKVFGLPDFAPYNRILVSAAATQVPSELLEQLQIGGRLVIPVHSSIWVIDKTGHEKYETVQHPGFAFVPLLREKWAGK